MTSGTSYGRPAGRECFPRGASLGVKNVAGGGTISHGGGPFRATHPPSAS